MRRSRQTEQTAIVRVAQGASHERNQNGNGRRKVSESVCSVCWSARLSVSIWVPSVSLALAFATLELTYVGMQTHA